jgi:hypothetical protein
MHIVKASNLFAAALVCSSVMCEGHQMKSRWTVGGLTNRAAGHAHAIEHIGRAVLPDVTAKRWIEERNIVETNATATGGNATSTTAEGTANSEETTNAEGGSTKQQEQAPLTQGQFPLQTRPDSLI